MPSIKKLKTGMILMLCLITICKISHAQSQGELYKRNSEQEARNLQNKIDAQNKAKADAIRAKELANSKTNAVVKPAATTIDPSLTPHQRYAFDFAGNSTSGFLLRNSRTVVVNDQSDRVWHIFIYQGTEQNNSGKKYVISYSGKYIRHDTLSKMGIDIYDTEQTLSELKNILTKKTKGKKPK